MSAGAERPARACPQGPRGRQAPVQAQGPASRKRGATAGRRREQEGGGPPARALELGRHREPAPAALRAGAAGRPRADPPEGLRPRAARGCRTATTCRQSSAALSTQRRPRGRRRTRVVGERWGLGGRPAAWERRRPAEPRGRPGRRPGSSAGRLPARAWAVAPRRRRRGGELPGEGGRRDPAVFVGESPIMAESNNRMKLTGAASFSGAPGCPGSPESK